VVRADGRILQPVRQPDWDSECWKYYISYCVFLAFEVVFVYFLFPETAHRTLEELAFLYEGDQVREQKKRVEEEIQLDERPSEADKKEDLSHVEHVH